MAYPTVDAAYGYKPIGLIGGQVFAGSTRNYPISYNYGTAIYYGDFVSLSTTAGTTIGTIIPSTTPVSTTNTTVGVFLGCYYTNPSTKQRLFSQFYPGNIAAGDITAIVADDPDQVFRVAVTTAAGATTIGSMSSITVGVNVAGNTLTGSAFTGNGAGAVVGATANTSGGGFRVLSLVPESQITTSATYVSGTGTTTLGVSGLSVGQVIPVGTDIYNVVSTGGLAGQLQFTGSSLTAAATVTTTGTTSLTVVASGITISGTVALVQSPEVLVKLNFGAHRYYVA
jgi:hypothetical protein